MLSNQRVVVTRAAHQAAGLVAAFEESGAAVVRLPLIELSPPGDSRGLERAGREVASYDLLVFTSANAVDVFLPKAEISGQHLPPCAVVGPATAAALRRWGVEPEVVAEKSRAEGLLEILIPSLPSAARVLIPQAADARPDLVAGLRAAGAHVTAVTAYRKSLPPEAEGIAGHLFAGSIGWVTFTSPRIAHHFARLFAGDWPRRRSELRAISIGPVTSGELRSLGVEPAAEAVRASDQALVEATLVASGITPARS